MTVRTRIPPSPTGSDLHIGNLYTALMNYTWAKKNSGQFIVRIEDTDRTRYVEGAEAQILATLRAYGLPPDETVDIGGPHGPYRQSDRLTIYREYIQRLIESGAAYYCTCTKERLDAVREAQKAAKQVSRYDKHCVTLQTEVKAQIDAGVPYVIRLNVLAGETIIVQDLLRGELKFDSSGVDDQVLMKSDGYPTYHFGVVVDDHLMGITHVVRAEEWITSTPKHVLLYRAFGWELPVFCHVPILRNPDKSKLSKRKNPVWANWFLTQGYMPEAILNYLALQGWSHPDQREIFDMAEFQRVFELADLKTVGPAFDIQKLDWMNGEYIRATEMNNLKLKIKNYLNTYNGTASDFIEKSSQIFERSLPLVRERMKILSDYWALCEFMYVRPATYEVDLTSHTSLIHATRDRLVALSGWTAATIGETMQAVCDELGTKRSEYFMVMRVAVSGKKISPPLNESMEILGHDEVIARLQALS